MRFSGRKAIILMLILLMALSPAVAQDIAVPDLTGMNIPRAAAALNRLGLALGSRQVQPWSEGAGFAPGTIVGQSIPPGTAAQGGGVVDVQVLQSTNARLVYDENDLTLVNTTGGDLSFNGLVFEVLEGTVPAAFNAARWSGGVGNNICAQIWSISRREPKSIEGCERIAHWISTRNTAEHFWTQLNGVTRFRVLQNGGERAVCSAAPVGSPLITCDLFLAGGGGGSVTEDATEYIYFAYTPERLIVHNRSEDRWMPLTGTNAINNNPSLAQRGLNVILSDSTLYGTRSPVADPSRLAPGQCLLFTNSSTPESLNLPEPCDVVGRLDIAPELIFWGADFGVASSRDGRTRTCKAATAGTLTICVMPR